MTQIKIFIELTRLNKPIGFLLLFWPCLWGLTLAYYYKDEGFIYLRYTFLFFLGAVLMRSAGCIFNDIVDRNLDKKVLRTMERPIASGKVSLFKSSIYIISLCMLALLILIQFNFLTIILGICSMFFAFAYPFMKRITYWPQLFLGLTFNWGIIMGYSSIANYISLEVVVLYISAIFWTLGYDTVYGLQDIHDDEIIGVKSTSIKFKKNVRVFVGVCYSLFILGILIMGLMMEINQYFFTLPIFFVLILFLSYQVKSFKINNPESCLLNFKRNNLIGIFLFLIIFSFNF